MPREGRFLVPVNSRKPRGVVDSRAMICPLLSSEMALLCLPTAGSTGTEHRSRYEHLRHF